MAIVFDGPNKRIILDTVVTSAEEIWSRWCDWLQTGTNDKWPLAFRQAGGDDLGGGRLIPTYMFLQNGWRIRPMESNHDLEVEGNLFVEEGGTPIVRTIGNYQVNVKYVVPVLAQTLAIGGSSGPTAAQIAIAVRNELAAELAMMKVVPALL